MMNNDSKEAFGIIMSMKPVYADMILRGHKKYEFRKNGFTKAVDKVLIYSTKPVGKIVGYFTFDTVLRDTPSKIWAKCFRFAGISQSHFNKYFEGLGTAYAIQIDKVFRLENPLSPSEIIKGFKAPRSFFYIDSSLIHDYIGH